MARIALHYFPGNTLLHSWDGRCKLIGLIMITLTLIQTRISWLLFDSILMISLFILSRFPFKQLCRELRFWMIFLTILFFFQAFLTPGMPLPTFPWLPMSREGLFLGGMTIWRLGLILSFGILFTAVTRPRELQEALIWFLKPLPFLPVRRIGLMVALTLRFFSRILDQAEEVQWAIRARSGDKQKNPFRKMKSLALPILRRSIMDAEEVSFALAARGYREDLPLSPLRLPYYHWMPLALLGGVLFMIR